MQKKIKVRNIIVFILISVISLTCFIVTLDRSVQQTLDTECSALSEELDDVYAFLNRYGRFGKLVTRIRQSAESSGLKINALTLSRQEVSEKNLTSLLELCDDGQALYYMDKAGRIISAEDSPALSLTLEERKTLLLQKTFTSTDGKKYYAAEPCGEGTLILSSPVKAEEEFLNTLSFYIGFDVFSFNAETGEAVQEACTEEIDCKIDDVVVREITEVDTGDSGHTAVLFGLPAIDGTLLNIYVGITDTRTVNGTRLFCYCCEPIYDALADCVTSVLLYAILLIAFLVLSVRCIRRFSRNSGTQSADVTRSYAAFNIGSLAVLFLLVTVFLQMLLLHTNFGLRTDRIMDHIPEVLSDREKAVDYIRNLYEESSIANLQKCEYYLSSVSGTGENITEEDLQVLADCLGADEMSVIDEDGKAIETTSGYKGYRISTNENDDEYALWSIINGADRTLFLQKSDGTNSCLCAVRRTDQIGLICMELFNPSVQFLIDRFDFENTLRNINFGTAERLYRNRNNPQIVYRIPNASADTEALSISDLPMPESGAVFSGNRKINGDKYFVTAQGFEDYVLYCANSFDMLTDGVLNLLIVSVITYGLLFFLLVFVYTAPSAGSQPAANDSSSVQNQKNPILSGIQTVTVLLLAIGALDFLIEREKSTLYYLLKGNWERKVNVLSIALAIFTIAIAYLLMKIHHSFNARLVKETSPRSATALQLIGSLFDAVLVIGLVLFNLNQFGVDTTTIVAGIGITGLALGIGAKDTITDFIAGIFLILDGNVLVGDLIETGDFYGQVEQVGIRCTKIRRGSETKMLHNSALSNVVSHDKKSVRVNVSFEVSPHTDPDKLRDLINGSSERFRRAAGERLLEAPVFAGVQEIGRFKMTCQFSFRADECDKSAVTAICRTELMKMLNETVSL